jgi:hypothetical protein
MSDAVEPLLAARSVRQLEAPSKIAEGSAHVVTGLRQDVSFRPQSFCKPETLKPKRHGNRHVLLDIERSCPTRRKRRA